MPLLRIQTKPVIMSLGKTALLPGGIASFTNYTSYSRGINGIMIDIMDLNSENLTLSDFEFRVGHNSDLSTWMTAPPPIEPIEVRPVQGVDKSDRVILTWPDNDIENEWLQVTVKANANTGLVSDDVFYFGNAVGETGDHDFQCERGCIRCDCRASQRHPIGDTAILENPMTSIVTVV